MSQGQQLLYVIYMMSIFKLFFREHDLKCGEDFSENVNFITVDVTYSIVVTKRMVGRRIKSLD